MKYKIASFNFNSFLNCDVLQHALLTIKKKIDVCFLKKCKNVKENITIFIC